MSTHTSSLLETKFTEKDFIQEPEGIVVISPQDLKPGLLGKLFHSGIKVVILKDPRIAKIWEGFLGSPNSNFENSLPIRMPWQENLYSMACNHAPNDVSLGDMLRFTPGIIGHIARKMKIFPVSDGNVMQAIPEYFLQRNEKLFYSDQLLQLVWELMSDVFKSTAPDISPAPYAVNIDILKYPNAVELEMVCALLADASGKWTQIGYKIDTYKGIAKGVFDKKIIRDLFGLSLLVPGMNILLRKLNTILNRNAKRSGANGMLTIGAEHVDSSKLLTGLVSDRDILKTQIYTGKCWVDLSLTPNTMAIFPSMRITKDSGFAPTWHRILLEKKAPGSGKSKQNVTLSLSITDR